MWHKLSSKMAKTEKAEVESVCCMVLDMESYEENIDRQIERRDDRK